MQAGSMKLDLKPVDLEAWLAQSMERWRSILGPGSELRREGPPLSSAALVDLRTLNLITDNILDNARKFSSGAPHVVIHTDQAANPTGRRKRPRWRLRFEDRGLGFNPDDSRRIFDRFFRGKTETPYAVPGTGLGLYLAQSASKSLGLTLHGDSKGPGQGATFTLEGSEHPPA
jgi:signal transduction histidine kinase